MKYLRLNTAGGLLTFSLAQLESASLRDKVASLALLYSQLEEQAGTINEGEANQESIQQSGWHICNHEDGGSCESDRPLSELTIEAIEEAINEQAA